MVRGQAHCVLGRVQQVVTVLQRKPGELDQGCTVTADRIAVVLGLLVEVQGRRVAVGHTVFQFLT
jgi:hypothetical protein